MSASASTAIAARMKPPAASSPRRSSRKRTARSPRVAASEAPKKYWKRAKCPYCGSNRVKKNDINAFSDNNAKEYRCTSFECGKQFNSEQVKEYEDVEVKERGPRPEYNPRLTD